MPPERQDERAGRSVPAARADRQYARREAAGAQSLIGEAMRSRSVGSGRNLRPSWIEIDRGAIQDNVRTIKSRLGSDVAMFCTLKSNACGFDLEQAGLLLEAESAAHGISLVDMGDAITLRER